MKKSTTNMVLSLLLGATLAACARTETTTTETETDTIAMPSETTATTADTAAAGSLPASDQEFVNNAAMGGLAEVQYGNLALQKASSEDVKTFAQRMVTDHSAANQELQSIATAKGVTLPTELTGTHKAGFDHLNSLSGAEFDKAYMEHMVADHEKDVTEFEEASNTATDADVKAFAAKTLPVLREHKQLADATMARVK